MPEYIYAECENLKLLNAKEAPQQQIERVTCSFSKTENENLGKSLQEALGWKRNKKKLCKNLPKWTKISEEFKADELKSPSISDAISNNV